MKYIQICIVHNYPFRNRVYLADLKKDHPILSNKEIRVTVCKLYRHPEKIKTKFDLIYIDEDTVNPSVAAEWQLHFPLAKVQWTSVKKDQKRKSKFISRVLKLKEDKNG